MEPKHNAPAIANQDAAQLENNAIRAPESDSSSCHDEGHWTFPQKYYVHWLWDQMQGEGLYRPHLKISHESKRQSQHDGATTVQLALKIRIDVCVRPPTKIDFVNALLRIWD